MLTASDFWLVSMHAAGIYISRDEGATWARVKPRRARVAGRAGDGPFPLLVATGAVERIYAGSASDGLYVLDLSGNSAPKSFAAGATGATDATGGH
jgi:hypothetical protein